MDRNKLVKRFVIGTFITLYTLVSIISTIHVIDFFELSNPYWLAVTLAIGFEIGAAASLASLVILKKMNKTLVWALFITITLMQMQGNMYYAFINLEDFGSWAELFDLIDEDIIDQKRILAFVSGAILPLIALGFIKSLVDYIKPEENEEWNDEIPEDSMLNDIEVNLEEEVEETYDAYVDRHEPDPIDESEFFAAHDNGFDEEHALDLVLNDMVEDLTDEELDDIFEEDLDLIDQELDSAEEELDKAEEELDKLEEESSKQFEVENTSGDVEVIKVNRSNSPSATDGMNPVEIEAWQTLHKANEGDLLNKALEDRAKSNMKDYIKKDSDANNKS